MSRNRHRHIRSLALGMQQHLLRVTVTVEWIAPLPTASISVGVQPNWCHSNRYGELVVKLTGSVPQSRLSLLMAQQFHVPTTSPMNGEAGFYNSLMQATTPLPTR